MTTGVASPSSKLLYIDDDKALCYLVKKGLERRGYSVETANSGPDGLAMAETSAYDLIAIDHYMPGQDGLVTLGQLQSLPQHPAGGLRHRLGRKPHRRRRTEGRCGRLCGEDRIGRFP